MSEIEQFSALVAAIYDASLDRSLWTSVLEQICAFVPAAVSNIFVQEGAAKRANVGFNYSLETTWNELYLTKYVKIDPTFPALLFCEAGEIFCTTYLVPAIQMARTRFYREYLQPQGLGEAVGAVLEKSVTSCAVFTVILSGNLGAVEEKRLKRVRLLVPHVQRAVFIGKAIDLAKATAEIQKAALGPSTFPELIAQHFRLTPTELAVLFLMVEVGGVPEVAGILGLSQATIKMHLLSVLTKTGTKDQIDLVKLVTRLANPVAQ
jgi:DNA-binding CsgD family transcriptional regulator